MATIPDPVLQPFEGSEQVVHVAKAVLRLFLERSSADSIQEARHA